MQLGPLYSAQAPESPQSVMEDLAKRAVVESVVNAIQKALEPPTPEEKERAQKEESRKVQEERDRQEAQADAVTRQAEQLRLTTSLNKDLDPASTKATAQQILSQTYGFTTGPGFDLSELRVGDEAAKAVERMKRAEEMEQGRDGTLDTSIAGLPGFTSELSERSLRVAGVIRLSLRDDSAPASVSNPLNEEQTFERGSPITFLSKNEALVSVRLDYADGTATRMELKYRKVDAEPTRDDSLDGTGRTGQKSDRRLAA